MDGPYQENVIEQMFGIAFEFTCECGAFPTVTPPGEIANEK